MLSPQCSVPATSPAPVQMDAVRAAPVRPVAARAAASRAGVWAARPHQTAAPAGTRRDPVRPGGRPARLAGSAAVRPVRGGCLSGVGRPAVAGSPDRCAPAPLRLTERGRRVVAGLSIAIGLSIAAVTVVTVELGGADGGLQLAGASSVVVQPGDTLWSIARSVAPGEDPRVVVDAIVDLNGLDGVDLLPGAELQLP